MMDRLLQADPRSLLIGMAGLALIVLAAGWQAVLRKPVAEYRELRHAHAEAATELAQAQDLPAQLESARHDADQAQRRLAALLNPMPEDEAAVRMVRELDRAAVATGVSLVSVRPLEQHRTGEFSEQPFEAEARGGYADLVNWVATVEADMSPALVTGFTLRPTGSSGGLTLMLTVSSFRMAETPKGNRT